MFLFAKSSPGDFEDFFLGAVGSHKEKYPDIRCVLIKEYNMYMLPKDLQISWFYDYCKLFEYNKFKESLAECKNTLKIQLSDICIFHINKESDFMNKMLTLAKNLNKKIVIISKKGIVEVT